MVGRMPTTESNLRTAVGVEIYKLGIVREDRVRCGDSKILLDYIFVKYC